MNNVFFFLIKKSLRELSVKIVFKYIKTLILLKKSLLLKLY